MTLGSVSFPSEARSLRAEDLHVGDWISYDVLLEEDDLERFAALTGDRSPIHVSADYAHLAGFPARIAHGMLIASQLSTVVGMLLPGRLAMLVSQKVDFLEPTLAGQTVSISARVSQVSAAARAATLSLTAIVGGLVVLRGTVVVRIRETY